MDHARQIAPPRALADCYSDRVGTHVRQAIRQVLKACRSSMKVSVFRRSTTRFKATNTSGSSSRPTYDSRCVRELFGGEWARLVQHVLANADLSDVVQAPGETHIL